MFAGAFAPLMPVRNTGKGGREQTSIRRQHIRPLPPTGRVIVQRSTHSTFNVVVGRMLVITPASAENVDLRRRTMGLGPLKDYLAGFGILYIKPEK